jgi:hypothetical protein
MSQWSQYKSSPEWFSVDRRYALTKAQVAKAMEMYNSGDHYWLGIAEHFRVDKSTLMRYIRAAEIYGYSFWTDRPNED